LYLGLKDKVPGLAHHNLLFSKDWRQNFREIFDEPQWPSDPSMYVCAPSVAETMWHLGAGKPVRSGADGSRLERCRWTARSLCATSTRNTGARVEHSKLRERIVYQRIFSGQRFRGALQQLSRLGAGLAHTIMQTAILRPNNVSKKLKNLYYVGATRIPASECRFV
jgi:phytoene desaturase